MALQMQHWGPFIAVCNTTLDAFVCIQGASLNPTTGILLVGVALAGYSAYQAYTYFTKACMR